jgi:RHS repeat-associated protein
VQYLVGNQQGTAGVAVDAASLAVTRRYYDPYGNPVGVAPESWPGTRGFVGGTADPATGLTDLGAREYDPATGAFISPDPLLSPGDPQDLNGYAYAGDSPVSNSDPSGLCARATATGSCPYDPLTGKPTGVGPGPAPAPAPTGSTPCSSSWQGCPGYTPPPVVAAPPPPVVKRTPRAVEPSQDTFAGGFCGQMTWKLGACSSERGAAGTTPQQVKQSLIGAAAVLTTAIPVGDVLDFLFGGSRVIATGEDVNAAANDRAAEPIDAGVEAAQLARLAAGQAPPQGGPVRSGPPTLGDRQTGEAGHGDHAGTICRQRPGVPRSSPDGPWLPARREARLDPAAGLPSVAVRLLPALVSRNGRSAYTSARVRADISADMGNPAHHLAAISAEQWRADEGNCHGPMDSAAPHP